MREITLEELLQAGCHFGHQVTRQNPKARDFVYEARDNIHIIDLAKTKEGLDAASAFIKDTAANSGSLLVVGTKRQAKPIVEEEIKRIIGELKDSPKFGIYYVTTRWIGGTLTNFFEVSKNYKKLKELINKLHSEEEKAKYTKKEIGLWQKEVQKLESFYGGTADMSKVPTAIFIIDTHVEELAVFEAHKMGVPVVGIVDTNSDPTLVDYPIPANDDAVGSLKLIISYIMDAWKEGKEDQRSSARQAQDKDQNEEQNEKKIETKSSEEPKKETKTSKKEKSAKTAKKPTKKTEKTK